MFLVVLFLVDDDSVGLRHEEVVEVRLALLLVVLPDAELLYVEVAQVGSKHAGGCDAKIVRYAVVPVGMPADDHVGCVVAEHSNQPDRGQNEGVDLELFVKKDGREVVEKHGHVEQVLVKCRVNFLHWNQVPVDEVKPNALQRQVDHCQPAELASFERPALRAARALAIHPNARPEQVNDVSNQKVKGLSELPKALDRAVNGIAGDEKKENLAYLVLRPHLVLDDVCPQDRVRHIQRPQVDLSLAVVEMQDTFAVVFLPSFRF